MQTKDATQGRVRQQVNNLVMAEMFLLQATIESAAVLGDGFNELGRQFGDTEEQGPASWDAVSGTLQRIVDNAMEPYTSRYRYFRDVISRDD